MQARVGLAPLAELRLPTWDEPIAITAVLVALTATAPPVPVLVEPLPRIVEQRAEAAPIAVERPPLIAVINLLVVEAPELQLAVVKEALPVVPLLNVMVPAEPKAVAVTTVVAVRPTIKVARNAARASNKEAIATRAPIVMPVLAAAVRVVADTNPAAAVEAIAALAPTTLHGAIAVATALHALAAAAEPADLLDLLEVQAPVALQDLHGVAVPAAPQVDHAAVAVVALQDQAAADADKNLTKTIDDEKTNRRLPTH